MVVCCRTLDTIDRLDSLYRYIDTLPCRLCRDAALYYCEVQCPDRMKCTCVNKNTGEKSEAGPVKSTPVKWSLGCFHNHIRSMLLPLVILYTNLETGHFQKIAHPSANSNPLLNHKITTMTFISTLVISETHNRWPHSSEYLSLNADIFIHCGDLTQYGDLPSFQRAIDNIKLVDAELKLVIAGNHDVDLDPRWLQGFAEDEDDVGIGAISCLLMKSQQEYDVYYLDERTHSFPLKDGRSFCGLCHALYA